MTCCLHKRWLFRMIAQKRWQRSNEVRNKWFKCTSAQLSSWSFIGRGLNHHYLNISSMIRNKLNSRQFNIIIYVSLLRDLNDNLFLLFCVCQSIMIKENRQLEKRWVRQVINLFIFTQFANIIHWKCICSLKKAAKKALQAQIELPNKNMNKCRDYQGKLMTTTTWWAMRQTEYYLFQVEAKTRCLLPLTHLIIAINILFKWDYGNRNLFNVYNIRQL